MYLLFGEEDYLMDEVINVIAEQVLGTGERVLIMITWMGKSLNLMISNLHRDTALWVSSTSGGGEELSLLPERQDKKRPKGTIAWPT